MASTGNHTERKMCRVKVNRLFVKEIYTFWQNLSKPDFRKEKRRMWDANNTKY